MTAVEAAERYLLDQGASPDLAAWTVAQPDCDVAALARSAGWSERSPREPGTDRRGRPLGRNTGEPGEPIRWRRER